MSFVRALSVSSELKVLRDNGIKNGPYSLLCGNIGCISFGETKHITIPENAETKELRILQERIERSVDNTIGVILYFTNC